MNNHKLGIPAIANPYLNPLYTVSGLIESGIESGFNNSTTSYTSELDYFLITNQAQDSESVSLMIPLSNQINSIVTNPSNPTAIADIDTIIITGYNDTYCNNLENLCIDGSAVNGLYNISGYDSFGLPIYTGGLGNNFKFNFNYYNGEEGNNLQYKFTKNYWELKQFKNIPTGWSDYEYHYRWELYKRQEDTDIEFEGNYLCGAYGKSGIWLAISKTLTGNNVLQYNNSNPENISIKIFTNVLPQDQLWRGIDYGTGRWIAIPKYDYNNGYLGFCQGAAKGATSIDNGVTWSEISINGQDIEPWGTPLQEFYNIKFNGQNRWILAGRAGMCSQGPTYQPIETGNSRILTSTDGINWSGQTYIPTPLGQTIFEYQKQFKALTYGNGLWIALNSYSYIPNAYYPYTPNTPYNYSLNNVGVYSTDGFNWSPFNVMTGASSQMIRGIIDVHFATGRFIGIPSNPANRFITSTDGTGNWSYITGFPITYGRSNTGSYRTYKSITHDGSSWIVTYDVDPLTGVQTEVLKSVDGINWSGVPVRTDGSNKQWNMVKSDGSGTSIIFGNKYIRVLDPTQAYYTQNYPEPIVENYFPIYKSASNLIGLLSSGNYVAEFNSPSPFILNYADLQYSATEYWAQPCDYIKGNVLIQSTLKEAYGTTNFASGLVNSTTGDFINFSELNYVFGVNTKNYSNSAWFINGFIYKYDYSDEYLIDYFSESYSLPQITITGSTYTFKFIQSPTISGHKIQYRTGLNNGWTTTGIQLSTSVDQSGVSNGNVRKEFYAYGPSATTGFYYRMRSYKFTPISVGNFTSSGNTGNNNFIQININDNNNIYYISLSGSNYSLLDSGKKFT
jgi:hypothetical protein